ncbi:amidase [Eremomyces bilateralis CBS 781.70]|uniref:amidase n=1 Tax=Eremomyces bilateralis CBS 781.70 TaxID=1392243 RepID=A0A6G1G1L3_9PEZI|nr:amidase [Eremomyces bilateralis CBS 781.70]KAF1811872.1 amidase [Eremomyces bilateralis CBS 781.70]
MSNQGWEAIAAAKRKALSDSIPSEWRIPADIFPAETQEDVTGFPKSSGWFTEKELEITGSTATQLLQKLASGELKSEEVTKAFCKRAAAAHQLTNCLSETLFAAALDTARSLDEHLARTGKPIGPLHGLPISLKDNFNLKGIDSTVGFIAYVNDPAKYDSVLAEILRGAGAVFYVKTNVPTAMMIAESVNNVFGRTVHPRNRNLTSGGSSGGESALIAFGGSVVGVGSDIGGSLRIPAACTGIFTLRPSSGRFPTTRCRAGLAGQEAVLSVNGPMTPNLNDLELYCKTVVGAEPWISDPRCIPIPWRSAELPQKLKIGVLWNDGMVTPTPPVKRALEHTVQKLKAAGHELVDWSHEDHAELLSVLARSFVSDGGKSVRETLKGTGEPFREEMSAYEQAKEVGGYDMWQLHIQRNEIQKRYLDRWNNAGIDVLLLPTTPFATVKNGQFKHVGYTGVYNVLDYAATSFPTGLSVDQDADKATGAGFKPLTSIDEEINSEYDAQAVLGMPISLQLVARRLEEEKVIEATKVVLDALSK